MREKLHFESIYDSRLEERPAHPPDHTACGTPNPPPWCEDAMSVPIDGYTIALILIAMIIAAVYLIRKIKR